MADTTIGIDGTAFGMEPWGDEPADVTRADVTVDGAVSRSVLVSELTRLFGAAYTAGVMNAGLSLRVTRHSYPAAADARRYTDILALRGNGLLGSDVDGAVLAWCSLEGKLGVLEAILCAELFGIEATSARATVEQHVYLAADA
jgi:hypothetical protein